MLMALTEYSKPGRLTTETQAALGIQLAEFLYLLFPLPPGTRWAGWYASYKLLLLKDTALIHIKSKQ